MKFNNIMIAAMDSFLPEDELTSAQIELRLKEFYQQHKLPFGRLEMMTGIRARKIWPAGTRPSHIATQAAKKVLQRNLIATEDIGLLIHASVCRDFLEPATASIIHGNLGLSRNCEFFDLSNACLGFLNSIQIAAAKLERDEIKAALIVLGDNSGPLIEGTLAAILNNDKLGRQGLKKYFANLTIGSGAVAALLSKKDILPFGIELLGGATMSDGSKSHLCQGSGDLANLEMQTDSEALLLAGIQLARDTFTLATSNLAWGPGDFQFVLTHQVGKAHEHLLMTGLELGGKKTYNTYPDLGNTGPCALPLTLLQACRNGTICDNDQGLLMGIGSGLSSIVLGVKAWTADNLNNKDLL